MAISDHDRKLLWAPSGNRCAFPGCQQELTEEGGDSSFPVGEEARIVARTPDGFRGSIFHLAVLEQYRDRGLGSALLMAAEQKLMSLGIFQINLMVYEENGFAESLYHRRGYERSPVKVLRKRFVSP